jgi:hypothetical protein
MGWPQQYTESDVDVPSAVLSGISDNAQEKMAFVIFTRRLGGTI